MELPTEEEFVTQSRQLQTGAVDGFIKLKLVHAGKATLIMPDLLAADLGRLKWFQPKFFYGCLIGFLDGYAVGNIQIELSGGAFVRVTILSSWLVASLPDRSQVFRCLISGAPDLAEEAAGTCSIGPDGDFLLDLFHHTTDAAAQAIAASCHYRGSRWNVQGTRELKNVEYAYFTSLPKIESEQDLHRIAMASGGRIALLRTNAASPADAIAIKVYRQSTSDRTATMRVAVPSSQVASQHVYRHDPDGEAVYYELCHPEIYRVGLQPGKVAPVQEGRLDVPAEDRKRFEYVVLGDADTAPGLIAPYDEEETRSLFHIEQCGGQTFFDFWRSNANSDRVTWRVPEMLQFKRDDAGA